MAGNLGGVTNFTGTRTGGGEAVPAPAGGVALTASAASEGVAQVWLSNRTFPLVALPLIANASTITVVPYPGAAVGDLARWHATSSMSSAAGNGGAFVNAANQVTVVLSNSSTAALTLVPQTIAVVVERYGAY